jgi:hypothetical protein
VFDCLDRGIGQYERQTQWLFRQMFNPLFWLKWIIAKLMGIPFEILRLAGYNADKMERSAGGKLVKAIVGLVTFLY